MHPDATTRTIQTQSKPTILKQAANGKKHSKRPQTMRTGNRCGSPKDWDSDQDVPHAGNPGKRQRWTRQLNCTAWMIPRYGPFWLLESTRVGVYKLPFFSTFVLTSHARGAMAKELTWHYKHS